MSCGCTTGYTCQMCLVTDGTNKVTGKQVVAKPEPKFKTCSGGGQRFCVCPPTVQDDTRL